MSLYLDTETTGLSPNAGDAIVEIAIVDDDGTKLLDTLVNPRRLIPSAATNIHGISSQMVIGKPFIEDVISKVRTIIKGQHLVIYNSAFDTAFFPCGLGAASKISCAMNRFGKAFGRRVKLANAAERAGHVWRGKAHRALADALACRSVWHWLDGDESATRRGQMLSSGTQPMNEVESCDVDNTHANDLVERILDWALDHPQFDTSWVENIRDRLEAGRALTERQMMGLENIVEKWKVA